MYPCSDEFSFTYCGLCLLTPSKYETLTKCSCNVGPPFMKLAQHYTNRCLICCVCWAGGGACYSQGGSGGSHAGRGGFGRDGSVVQYASDPFCSIYEACVWGSGGGCSSSSRGGGYLHIHVVNHTIVNGHIQADANHATVSTTMYFLILTIVLITN